MIKKIWVIILIVTCTTFLQTLSWGAEKKAEPSVTGLSSSLNSLKEEILSYFVPITGDINSVDGQAVTIDKGTSASVKVGMRFTVFKEGAVFIHPVTKEPLGNIQAPVGTLEVLSTDASSSKGITITGKPEDFQNAKIKIPARQIRILFYQGNLDWYLGDAYYHSLLDSGRFEIVDTALQNATPAEIVAEAKAKNVEVALALSAEETKTTVDVTQKLYWVPDGKQFSDTKTSVHVAVVKELKFSAGPYAPREGEALLSYKMPFSARRLAVGDFDGDGNPDIVLASGDHVGIYKPDTNLKLLWEFDPPGSGEILWIDTVDIKKNGHDVILITTLAKGGNTIGAWDDALIRVDPSASRTRVRSYIYELEGGTFKRVWQAKDVFIRKAENGIIAQSFSGGEGFEGRMFEINYADGNFKKGAEIKLPHGVNIYDFQYVYAPDGRRALFAWDDNGYLNFYNDKGIRTWVSKEDFGGFADSYKKESGDVMIDKGSWTLKDRLVANDSTILATKRKSLLNFAKSLGYSSAELKSYWWNGISVEETSFLDNVGGDILDYAVIGDRLLVLVKPYMWNEAKDLIKGQSLEGRRLYIYSTKGR
ncbi:MAG: FG-GAP repeat domain-containing protein [Dissulfurispiraceae bacterium]|jgi:hypothetical protein